MNTKHEHTPGPWLRLPRRASDNTIGISDDSKLTPLAYVCPRPFYDDVQNANARLIAAAPEMFQALTAIANMQTTSDTNYAELCALMTALARTTLATKRK